MDETDNNNNTELGGDGATSIANDPIVGIPTVSPPQNPPPAVPLSISSLLISTPLTDKSEVTSENNETQEQQQQHSSLFRNLWDGFTYLRQRRENGKEIQPPASVLPSFLNNVTVKFIDPTTTSIAATSYHHTHEQHNHNTTIHLYEKFASVFEKDYNSTLSYVPYQLFRNNSSGVIERLPVKTVVARSHGGGLVLLPQDTEEDDVRNNDPWDDPYCYVYLAACESLEHYRTKVKPSIQVFVSQLEASSKVQAQRRGIVGTTSIASGTNNSNYNNSTSSATEGIMNRDMIPPGTPPTTKGSSNKKKKITNRMKSAPRYVIVYVPTGDRTVPETTTNTTTSGIASPKKNALVATGFGSRIAAARQRMAAAREGAILPLESGHGNGGSSTTTTTTTTTKINDFNANVDATTDTIITPASAIQKLNKVEREILKRFQNDFSNGNVCTLSTLTEAVISVSDRPGDNNDDTTKSSPSPPITTTTTATTTSSTNNDFSKLEWSIVMKSMATAIVAGFQDRCQNYDDDLRKMDLQRRGNAIQSNNGEDRIAADDLHLSNFWLTKENLALTYEQMRLPGEALLQYEELRAFLPDPNELPYDDTVEEMSELLHVAVTGQALAFRKILRSCKVFLPIVLVAEDYIFAREMSLHFQMHRTVRLLQRCLLHVESTFDFRKARLDIRYLDNEEEYSRKLDQLEKWAFTFCWDTKKAVECYRGMDESTKTGTDIAFARALSNLLAFSRVRMVKLGESKFPDFSQNKMTSQGLIQAIQGPWEPWTESPSTVESSSPIVTDDSFDFLEIALSTESSFISRYLELTDFLAKCYECCERKRIAATIRIQRMEIYSSRGDFTSASKEILAITDIYKNDSWCACHCALIIRLASFQRQLGSASDYLETLVNSFSGPLSECTPQKAKEALHADLESVLACTSNKGLNFTSAPLFSPAFGLEGITAPQALGSDRNLAKRLYTIGDTIGVTVALESFLPKCIQVDQISVNLVAFPTYVAAMEDNLMINESDVYRMLTLKTKQVKSGNNIFIFDWNPKAGGQFIISSVVLSWNGTDFVYTAKQSGRPTIRIDVVPCEASQTLSVKPDYLLPGQEQLITIEFNAGTDIVKEGTVSVVGCPGLLILPPGLEEEKENGIYWSTSFDAPLPPCLPLETVYVKAWVKVSLPRSFIASIQPIEVKVATSYNYGGDENDEETKEILETSLEAKIPTLSKPALSVVNGTFMAYSAFNAMINVTLRCNTLSPLILKSWQLELPSNVVLSDCGDFNDCIVDTTVSLGDDVSFSFDCSLNDAGTSSASKEDPVLHVDVEAKDGEAFRESLKLRIGRSAIPTSKSSEAKPIEYKVLCSASEGMVGSPVQIIYEIETSVLRKITGTIYYKLSPDVSNWILSGRVEAMVVLDECMNYRVVVFAIPVRCGPIDKYPDITFSLKTESGSATLPVHLASTAVFRSLTMQSHVSVAFPIGQSVRKTSSS